MILSTISAPAQATETQPSNVSSVIQDIVPDIYAQTSPSSEVSISEDLEQQEISVHDQGEGIENSEVEISLGNSGERSFQQDGLRFVASNDPNAQQIIQPLSEGFRILNVSFNELAPKEYSFELKLPAGAYPEMVMGTVRINRGDEILGSIKEPWARDANGTLVETYFTVKEFTVTQHLVTNTETLYPVISDPNWGYVGIWNLTGSYKVAWERLHLCFDCYFPVEGAPSHWPKFGQILPLKVGIINMECAMNYVFTATTYYRWKFIATKNHLDGEGSNIIFDLRVTSTGKSQLVVDAFIKNDIPLPGGNEAYEIMARLNWYRFATNLNTY